MRELLEESGLDGDRLPRRQRQPLSQRAPITAVLDAIVCGAYRPLKLEHINAVHDVREAEGQSRPAGDSCG